MLLRRMRRLTKDRLAGFSRQLKTLIDKAQRLRDEINRSIIASTPPPGNAAAAGVRRGRDADRFVRKDGLGQPRMLERVMRARGCIRIRDGSRASRRRSGCPRRRRATTEQRDGGCGAEQRPR